MDSKVVWFTWEDHRRSRELSRAFGAKYVLLALDRDRFIRYPVLSILTLFNLIIFRPNKVFCQNPSIVLAFLLVILKPLFRYKLIVDRHSNFKFEHEKSRRLRWRLFWFLSKYTIKKSELTIVTNEPLQKICESWGGRACVLPDKLPEMSVGDVDDLYIEGEKEECFVKVMCITAFGGDEPIDEMLLAASILGERFRFYLTGNFRKYIDRKAGSLVFPDNVNFTGFISEFNYKLLLKESDVVVVLTTKDLILNCGAYEAISAIKPLVLSDTRTLRSYFEPGPVFVNIDPQSIADGIQLAWDERGLAKAQLTKLSGRLTESWKQQFEEVVKHIDLN